MGLIQKIIGGPAATTALGTAATNVAQVFLPNATRQMELGHEAFTAALAEHGEEFKHIRPGLFDQVMNGINRMPRPMLALGTLGLFVYAMIDPAGFAQRMVGLGYVPEPLWWLLGAIVSFYFGAREAYYFRTRTPRRRRAAIADGAADMLPAGVMSDPAADPAADGDAGAGEVADDGNAALAEWRARSAG